MTRLSATYGSGGQATPQIGDHVNFSPFHQWYDMNDYIYSYVVDPAWCVFASLAVPGERVRLSGNRPRYKTNLFLEIFFL